MGLIEEPIHLEIPHDQFIKPSQSWILRGNSD